MSPLTADAAAWVAAADAKWAAQVSAIDTEAGGPSWMNDSAFHDEVDPVEAEDEMPTPYGPAVPGAGPVVLLDVDGVLAPLRSPRRKHWTTWRKVPHGMYHAQVSPQMGRALRRIPVQYVWLTSWNEQAPLLVGPTAALDDYPVLDEQAGHRFRDEYDGWSKLHVVRRWLRTYGPRPLVWVDDDGRLETLVKDDPYVSSLPAVLRINPDGRVGLLPEHIEAIANFVAEHTA